MNCCLGPEFDWNQKKILGAGLYFCMEADLDCFVGTELDYWLNLIAAWTQLLMGVDLTVSWGWT